MKLANQNLVIEKLKKKLESITIKRDKLRKVMEDKMAQLEKLNREIKNVNREKNSRIIQILMAELEKKGVPIDDVLIADIVEKVGNREIDEEKKEFLYTNIEEKMEGENGEENENPGTPITPPITPKISEEFL